MPLATFTPQPMVSDFSVAMEAFSTLREVAVSGAAQPNIPWMSHTANCRCPLCR